MSIPHGEGRGRTMPCIAMQVWFPTGWDGFWIGQAKSLGLFNVPAGYKTLSWSAWKQSVVDIPWWAAAFTGLQAILGFCSMVWCSYWMLCYPHWTGTWISTSSLVYELVHEFIKFSISPSILCRHFRTPLPEHPCQVWAEHIEMKAQRP